MRHGRAINGKCFMSSLYETDGTSAVQPVPSAPARGGNHGTGGKAELQFTSWPQTRGQSHLQSPSWLLPFAEHQTAMVAVTCCQCRRTSEKPEEMQKHLLLFTEHFRASEAAFRGCMTN